MNTNELFPIASISPAAIDAIVRQARADRAAVMRASLIKPNRARLPQSGIWA